MYANPCFQALVLWYREVFCPSEHSLINQKEQEVGINCLYLAMLCFRIKYYKYLQWWGGGILIQGRSLSFEPGEDTEQAGENLPVPKEGALRKRSAMLSHQEWAGYRQYDLIYYGINSIILYKLRYYSMYISRIGKNI